jgi:acid phosphatase type 7
MREAMRQVINHLFKFTFILSLLLLAEAPNPLPVQAVADRPSEKTPQASSNIYLPTVMHLGLEPGEASILAAGDIAKCDFPGAQETAAIIQGLPGTVLPLGDNAYDNGSALDYANCYVPTWGAFLNRTRPVPGNHDYITPGATGYFGYYGAVAGDSTKGYYSFDLGSWHILAINSNCSQVGGCGIHTPQDNWVKADLAANTAACVLAFWHHPFYSSGQTGNTPQMATIFKDLYNAGAEIVLSGHDHDYERFAPQDDKGILNPNLGVVQFVVGTGGGNFTPLVLPLQPNSLASAQNVYGVLQLTLHPTSYTWAFISADGSYSDSGSATCH